MRQHSRIYLDHAATTAVRPEAREAVTHGLTIWANPSSPHGEGRAARAALEEARARVTAALGWEGECIFVSGASEAAAIALGRARGGPRMVGAAEHDAVLQAAPGAAILPVQADGALDLAVLAGTLAGAQAPVVAAQTINSETGARQDVGAIADIVHAAGGLLVVDASQSAGKEPLPAAADMAILSAHKFGGPPGIGALLVRDFAMLEPSSGQERGYRRGTENLPGALGMAAALEACAQPYVAADVLAPMREVLTPALWAMGGVRLADGLSAPSPWIEALAMPGVSGSAQVMRFDMAGFAVSQGSACSSGSLRPSRVLAAMSVAPELAARVIRVSFGWNTTREEVAAFCEAWIAMADRAQTA